MSSDATPNRSPNRRQFLAATASAAAITAAPMFIPRTSLGYGRTAPSDRIAIGAIGCGGKGRHNTSAFLADDRVQVIAACDVDANHLNQGADLIDAHYKNSDCARVEDLRELIARSDIDAVHVSTPDHWHSFASVRAMQAGKDVYCEKPLANSFGESKAIRDTAIRTGRILQCGSHERSNNNCRFAAELVRSGRIGKVHTVRIQMPCEQDHHMSARAFRKKAEPQEIPEGLNWDMWQGHTHPVAYWEKGCHFWWRFILNYGGGEMTDRGAHIIDIAQLGLNRDSSGPVSFEAKGIQVAESPYDAFWDYEFTNTYADGTKLIGTTEGPRGLKFEGEDGWIFVAIHGGALSASDPEVLPQSVRDGKPVAFDQIDDSLKVQLGRSAGHHKNFIDCIISRAEPMATAEIGHRTATICHLNNIAMKVGRPVRWDPGTEELIGDFEAGELLLPNMRDPWQV
ncbi:Gfo/Idh/MocA family protein [Mariniblastus fucicola]|nr:Gfo/Idh/MocA family oxidoreductase [Mariniblastus fucicola]